jgi:hypothetical protein
VKSNSGNDIPGYQPSVASLQQTENFLFNYNSTLSASVAEPCRRSRILLTKKEQVGAGIGAITRCGLHSDDYLCDIKHKNVAFKNGNNFKSL